MMGDTWVNFVKTGRPRVPGLPGNWPTIDSGQIMLLGAFSTVIPALRPEAEVVFGGWWKSGGRVTLF